MRGRRLLPVLFALLVTLVNQRNALAQKSEWKHRPQNQLLFFADLYGALDNQAASFDVRSPFLYHHNRPKNLALNLALFQWDLNHSKYRTTIGIQAGSYREDNYAQEPELLRVLHNASVGLSLHRNGTWWIDGGIFAAHLGFENAQSTENLTLTRSLSAEQSPYYLSGLKTEWKPNSKWNFAALVLNGWQRIHWNSATNLPAFGMQVTRKTDYWLFNYSNYLGNEYINSKGYFRHFHNLYVKYNSGKWSGIIGLDIGAQQFSKQPAQMHVWLVPTLIVSYQLAKKWRTAVRSEYFYDPNSVLLPTYSNQIFSSSLNLDFKANHLLTLRIEARYFNGLNTSENTPANRLSLVGSLAFRFVHKMNKVIPVLTK